MLPKYRRLSRQDFNFCNATGKTLKFSNFLIKASPNALKYCRFGIVTSSRLSKSAVVRNSLRRRIYSRLRDLNCELGFDLIVFVQKSMLNSRDEDLYSLLNQALSEISHQSAFLLPL